jgi:hypothetical protein
MFAITVAGAYVTVPETKRLLLMVGAAAALPLHGWPIAVAALGRAGVYAATGLVLWASTLDGISRLSSIVGATACLGLFVVEPVARVLAGGRSPVAALPARWPAPVTAIVVSAVHAALVFVAARVAGLRQDTGEAVVIIAAAFAIAILLCTLVGRAAPATASD